MVSSVHLTVCFLFFSLLGFDPRKIYYLPNLACDIFASLRPRSVYKDVLSNVISHIDHVVMNHQIKLKLMEYEAMFAMEMV
jgi:hypothetical protein